MESRISSSALFFLALLSVSATLSAPMSPSPDASSPDTDLELHTYIIRMRIPDSTIFSSDQTLENWYRSLLPPTAANSTVSRFVYAYSDAITGFAARLTEEEIGFIAKKQGFLAAYRDYTLPLLTTHTPQVLGLQPGHGPWSNSNMGKGVIIGILDSGFTPGHPSFADDGMTPPSPKWKGECGQGLTVCNKKVIGARAFITSGAADSDTGPVDVYGHGTHTSTTAAGNFVSNSSVLGSANGTASGIAPRAYLSIYKVCNYGACSAADIVAGMDAAIKDGVDVLSISLGAGTLDLYNDVIAIGAFSAMEKGIFVSCAGGNSGPQSLTLSNESPWVLTVGASTIDRNIRATVNLGNGVELDGESAYQPSDFSSSMLPLVFSNCASTGENMTDMTGKMVACRFGYGSRIALGETVKANGGKAMIIINEEDYGFTTLAEAHLLPASHLNYLNGSSVEEYVNTTENPVASITFKGTILGVSPSPTVSFFSSRGPSFVSQDILKPDIIGPGVNVLAAWPTKVGPAGADVSTFNFNMISGTSMSTPHLSGIAALIKAEHSGWSPAAIKSAIMTTADLVDSNGNPIGDEQHRNAGFFEMGAGHVNPSKAVDPGLVYDIEADDYIGFLCGLPGYSDDQVELITHRKVNCSEVTKMKAMELNYPAISIASPDVTVNFTVNRTVKYVGEGKSTFKVKLDGLQGVTVKVSPEIMEFSGENETKTYTVSFTWKTVGGKVVEGNLWWVSDKYSVRIPVIIPESN
ncbi:subtilisin-like protease SBT1.7 [Canna indica]|uniref:Subtilisin-like protease SBT1.7 n=1 Tax=Canna indica TaxID=4628 RepID=A0AAQ3K4Q5_9LILI|nr:subtilisin-like protease SBT1.7 [Canna indica]